MEWHGTVMNKLNAAFAGGLAHTLIKTNVGLLVGITPPSAAIRLAKLLGTQWHACFTIARVRG